MPPAPAPAATRRVRLAPPAAVFAALVALTLLTWLAGELGHGGRLALAVLALALAKGALVADHFMELRAVRAFWRVLLYAYLATVGAAIALAFGLAHTP